MVVLEDYRKYDVRCVKCLYSIANFLALVPPYLANDRGKAKCYQWYAFTVALLMSLVFGATVYDITQGITGDSNTINFVLYLTMTFACLEVVLGMLITAFCNINNFSRLIVTFYEVDRCFESNLHYQTSYDIFLVEVCVLHALLIFLFMSDLFISIPTYGILGFFSKLLIRRIEIYQNAIFVHLMYSYCLAIRYRFRKINKHLVKTIRPNSSHKMYSFLNTDTAIEIKKARTAYNLLNKVVTIYSKIFGWQILFLFIHTGMVMLELICKEILSSNEMTTRLKLFMFATTNSVMAIVVAVSCDKTTKEAHRTATVCYNLLLDVPTLSSNLHERIVREELLMLAQQASHQCPFFSAAGFFNVDYTLIFGLLGTITSYVIVLIQINK